MKRMRIAIAIGIAALVAVGVAGASSPGLDSRLTNDRCATPSTPGCYVSAYTLATGTPYTDATLDECSHPRGRQNEPAVAVDPRNTSVLLGSSNDYCGVYNAIGATACRSASGPIWLGYYRSRERRARA